MKVFSIYKYLEYVKSVRPNDYKVEKAVINYGCTHWAKDLEGMATEQIRANKYVTMDEWMVEEKDFIKYIPEEIKGKEA